MLYESQTLFKYFIVNKKYVSYVFIHFCGTQNILMFRLSEAYINKKTINVSKI